MADNKSVITDSLPPANSAPTYFEMLNARVKVEKGTRIRKMASIWAPSLDDEIELFLIVRHALKDSICDYKSFWDHLKRRLVEYEEKADNLRRQSDNLLRDWAKERKAIILSPDNETQSDMPDIFSGSHRGDKFLTKDGRIATLLNDFTDQPLVQVEGEDPYVYYPDGTTDEPSGRDIVKKLNTNT